MISARLGTYPSRLNLMMQTSIHTQRRRYWVNTEEGPVFKYIHRPNKDKGHRYTGAPKNRNTGLRRKREKRKPSTGKIIDKYLNNPDRPTPYLLTLEEYMVEVEGRESIRRLNRVALTKVDTFSTFLILYSFLGIL